jgi:hypothetical protein
MPDDIQHFLIFTLHIFRACHSGDVTQARPVDFPTQDFCCQANIPKEAGELAGSIGELILIEVDPAVKGGTNRSAERFDFFVHAFF